MFVAKGRSKGVSETELWPIITPYFDDRLRRSFERIPASIPKNLENVLMMLTGKTKKTTRTCGDVEVLYRLRQRFDEPITAFLNRVEDSVDETVPPGVENGIHRRRVFLQGMLPAFREAAGETPPDDMGLLLIQCLKQVDNTALRSIQKPVTMKSYHHRQGEEPQRRSALQIHCYNCNRIGHKASDCRNGKNPGERVSLFSFNNAYYTDFIYMQFELKGQSVRAVADTGATLSLIRLDAVPKSVEIMRECINIRGLGNTRYRTEGKITVKLGYEKGAIEAELYVVTQLPERMLIGLDILGEISTGIDIENKTIIWKKIIAHIRVESAPLEFELVSHGAERIVNKLKADFGGVLSQGPHDLGKVKKVEHEIVTKGNPVRQTYRSIPQSLEKEFREQLNEMRRQGIIVPSKSPYASTALLQKKG